MRSQLSKAQRLPSVKGKAVLLQAWSGPEGSKKLRFPDFMTTVQNGGKVSALCTGCLYPPGNTPGTHLLIVILKNMTICMILRINNFLAKLCIFGMEICVLYNSESQTFWYQTSLTMSCQFYRPPPQNYLHSWAPYPQLTVNI